MKGTHSPWPRKEAWISGACCHSKRAWTPPWAGSKCAFDPRGGLGTGPRVTPVTATTYYGHSNLKDSHSRQRSHYGHTSQFATTVAAAHKNDFFQ